MRNRKPLELRGSVRKVNRAVQAALLAIVTLSLGSQPTLAHHSAAMYDASKTVTLHGKLRKVQISNPHSWLWIAVAEQGGAEDIWALESHGATQFLKRNPDAKRELTAGQEVTAKIHPLRDGRHSGLLVEVTLKSGKVFD